MRLSDLMRRRVVTESGKRLGRIHDVRGELRGSRLVVTGLVVGPRGWLEHLGLHFRNGAGGGRKHRGSVDAVAWRDVVRIGPEVVVRDPDG
jgi:sporulation protein YlmC with PRC-barrel domain